MPLRKFGDVQTKFHASSPMALYRAEQKGEGSPLLAGAILPSVHRLTNLVTKLNWKPQTFPFPLSQKLTFREVFRGCGGVFSKKPPHNASGS